MNKFLIKLECKYGHCAIPDLIKYIVGIYCAGAVIGMINPNIYYQYLSLNMEAVFHGQVWRLVTFLLEPYGFKQGLGFVISLLFFLIQVQLFFLFGRSLEGAWGTFRFNVYILSGYLFNIVAALILYVSPLHATLYDSGMQYIYWSMFFAFAMLNPNMEFLLYMIIPIKVKWLAMLDAAFMLYEVIRNAYYGIRLLQLGQSVYASAYFSVAVAIVVAMANFLIFFFSSRNNPGVSFARRQRKKQFQRRAQSETGQGRGQGMPRHRCAICGRTELDDETLDFRYCSKCDGDYEYCSDHLFTHEHVRK